MGGAVPVWDTKINTSEDGKSMAVPRFAENGYSTLVFGSQIYTEAGLLATATLHPCVSFSLGPKVQLGLQPRLFKGGLICLCGTNTKTELESGMGMKC